MSEGMLTAMVTVQTTIIASIVTPIPNAIRQITASGSNIASDSSDSATTAPPNTTNKIGRLGVHRSDTTPPTIRPTPSAAVIRPQAWAPPRCARATAGPSTWKPPYQAASTTVNWSMVTHSHLCDQNSDQPSRSSRTMLGAAATSEESETWTGPSRIAIISGTAVSVPRPQTASAHPGPNSATHSPASAAPPIMATFIASRLSALASCSWLVGTRRGSSAVDAG